MTQKKFIESKQRVLWFRLRLRKLKEITVFGNPVYKQIGVKQKWERYGYDDSEQLRTIAFGYRAYPYPSTSELIQLAIHSKFIDNTIGASRLLYSLESKGFEYRDQLLNALEALDSQLDKSKFRNIYHHANLFNKGNLRDSLNVSYTSVSNDFNTYISFFERAENIRTKIFQDT